MSSTNPSEPQAIPLDKKRIQAKVCEMLHPDNREFSLDVVKTIISGLGFVATVLAAVGLFCNYQNSQQEQHLNSERLMTDRFSKAVEQLGSRDIPVRIGGIYALERIAKDSPKDHRTIMEVLTAFVRSKSLKEESQSPKQEYTKFTTDVQSALTVLARRDTSNEPKDRYLDLSGISIEGANLNNANLANVSFDGTSLSSAHLEGANLTRALFSNAYLDGATLINANLRNATLKNTKLRNARLKGALLSDAILEGTDFTYSDLSDEQVKSAKLCHTILPTGKITDRDCGK